jgi:hypothetical protein
MYCERVPLQNELQLVKRRQVLLESNLPRNSQPETHRFNEEGRGLEGSRPYRMDRFPHA